MNAGDNLLVRSAGETVQLHGQVRDDALPEGETLLVEWTVKFGPGEVLFADPADPTTTAHSPFKRIYLLELAADDTEFQVADSMEVRVEAPCSVNITEGLVSWWQANCDGIDHISANIGFLEGVTFADPAVCGIQF